MSQADHLQYILSNPGSPKPPGASRNAFKPLFHHLPVFKTDGEMKEIFHNLDVKNVMADKDKIRIPSKWNSKPNIIRTQTHLARVRKEESIPDKTFDLNGDGTVSAHEYAIAKMFDFDFDGKLNEQERAFWLQRLKEGFESNLYWDADQGDQRIIQKDGKIIMSDADFKFSGSDKDNAQFGKTLPMLQVERLNDRKSLNAKVFENFLQKEQVKKEIIEKMWSVKPVKSNSDFKTTLSEVKLNRKLIHRQKAGLSPEPHDEKSLRKDPSIGYLNSPKVKTFTTLVQKRLNDNWVDYKFKFNNSSSKNELWTFDNKLLDPISNLPQKRDKIVNPRDMSPIEKTYNKQVIKNELTDKINDVVVFPGYKHRKEFIQNKVKPDIKYKWSTLEDKFRWGIQNRMYDEYPIYSDYSTDMLPLYSSFAKDQQLKIPNLPGRKMIPGLEVSDNPEETRKSAMYSSLYGKKDNMFNRVSPDKSVMRISKSSIDLKASPKSPRKIKNFMDEASGKTQSLLKKCALQGIRSSSFKNI